MGHKRKHMNIEFPEDEGKEIIEFSLAAGVYVKFAIVENTQEKIFTLLLFSSKFEHKSIVSERLKQNNRFIGAGKIDPNSRLAKWESSSCKVEFGYDKPSDSAEARSLLEDIHKRLKTLIKS